MSTINHIATNFQPNPEYKPPKQLQTNETQCLREILGLYRLPIVTAVAQILHGIHGQWQKIVCGVLCFVKDSDRRLYLLQVFDLRSRTCIYEETAFATTRLEKCTDVFYTFNGINCKVGINFVDRDDAQTFFHHFQKKQEARQIRKTQRANVPVTPALDTKAPDSTVKASEKKSFAKRFFTIGRKEGAKVEISSPLHHTFDHRNGITIDGYVFKDEDCLKLFQTVLSDMNLTAEDKEYMQQDFVKNKDGFKEFVQKKNISSGDPAVSNENRDAPSTMPSAGHSVNIGGNKHVRRPFQDITTPSFTYFQTPSVPHPQSKADIPPPIPPRGRAQAPVSSPWPTPPSTIEPVIPTPASGPSVIPPAPPLPPVIPPAPPLPPVDSSILKIPRPIENDSLSPETKPDKAKSDTPKARTWLDDIVDNRPVLKQVPIVTEQPPPVKAQKTMEDYIREKIEEGRKALMGRNNGEEEAETDGDDGFSD